MIDLLSRDARNPALRDLRALGALVVAIGAASLAWRAICPTVIYAAAVATMDSFNNPRLMYAALKQSNPEVPEETEFHWLKSEHLAIFSSFRIESGRVDGAGWVRVQGPVSPLVSLPESESTMVTYYDGWLRPKGRHRTNLSPETPPVDMDGDGRFEVVERRRGSHEFDRTREVAVFVVLRLHESQNEVLSVAYLDYRVWPLTRPRPQSASYVNPIWRDEDGDGVFELVFVTQESYQDPYWGLGYRPAETVAVFEWDAGANTMRPRFLPKDCGIIASFPRSANRIGQDEPLERTAHRLFPLPDDFGR